MQMALPQWLMAGDPCNPVPLSALPNDYAKEREFAQCIPLFSAAQVKLLPAYIAFICPSVSVLIAHSAQQMFTSAFHDT